MPRTFYYARVSTREQNLDRQLEAFKTLGAKEREIITDKESGKDLDRPGYQALKTTILRPGDTLIIKSLDRLSRSKADIRNELQWFKDNHIRLKVIDLPTMLMCDKVTLEFDRQQPIIPILYFDAENSIIHSINYVIIGAANLANKYV